MEIRSLGSGYKIRQFNSQLLQFWRLSSNLFQHLPRRFQIRGKIIAPDCSLPAECTHGLDRALKGTQLPVVVELSTRLAVNLFSFYTGKVEQGGSAFN